jgi:hypothetical protein
MSGKKRGMKRVYVAEAVAPSLISLNHLMFAV